MKLLALLLFLTGCQLTAVAYTPYRYSFTYLYRGHPVDFLATTLYECRYMRDRAWRQGYLILSPCWRL